MCEKNVKRVYDVSDIQKILNIGRSKTYEFLDETYTNQKPFTVLRIGKLYKVPKEPFDLWVSGGN